MLIQDKQNLSSMHILGRWEDVLPHLPDNSVDLILTDPPYEISQKDDGFAGGCWGKPGDPGYMKRPLLDFGDWDKEPVNLSNLFAEYYRVLKPSGTLICFYDIWKIHRLAEAGAKFSQHRLCIWQKSNPVPVNSALNYLTNSREYFITMVKGSKPTFHSKYDNGLYQYPIVHGNERTEHPTQKPVELIKQLLLKHSNEGELVLDTFAGSATTADACLQTNRKFISVEASNKYYDIGRTRLKQRVRNKLFAIDDVVFTTTDQI